MMEENKKPAGKAAEKTTRKSVDTDVGIMDNEGKYNKAISLMKAMNSMLLSNDKVKMYEELEQQFSELSDYMDANQYAEECKKLAKETMDMLNEQIYEKAINIKHTAGKPEEYIAAAKEFSKLGHYKDAKELAEQCELMSTQLVNKSSKRKMVKFSFIVLLTIAAILFINTSHAKYYYANACSLTGSYESAIKMYKKLGEYKDCEERLVESRYKYALKAEESGKYSLAKKEYTMAGTYKDSANKKVEMEKLLIRNSKAGDIIKIGDTEWVILELNDNKALLRKKAALKNVAYHNSSGDVTWENSALRTWLNTEYLENDFSVEERSEILLTQLMNEDNIHSGVNGGNPTEDYLFILSIGEAEKYADMLTESKYNSWLRTPGQSQSSVAFLSPSGTIMSYGYAADSTDMAVYPLMWFNVE